MKVSLARLVRSGARSLRISATLAVVGLVTALAAIVTPASVSGGDSPSQAPGSTSSSGPQTTAADGPSRSTDKTVYVRGSSMCPALSKPNA